MSQGANEPVAGVVPGMPAANPEAGAAWPERVRDRDQFWDRGPQGVVRDQGVGAVARAPS